MSEAPADLTMMMHLLLRQVIAEQQATRDDLRVVTAIAMRQDNTLATLLVEVRAMHGQ